MQFSLTIQPHETARVYGINSTSGFKIVSLKEIRDFASIREIILAFVDHSTATNEFLLREKKFTQYVSWKPREEWENDTESRHFERAKERFNNASESYSKIGSRYQIIEITPFE